MMSVSPKEDRRGHACKNLCSEIPAPGLIDLRFLRGCLGAVLPNADGVDLPSSLPVKVPADARIYDWTGFYVGGHVGLALGNSNWTANATTPGAPPVAGSPNIVAPPHG